MSKAVLDSDIYGDIYGDDEDPLVSVTSPSDEQYQLDEEGEEEDDLTIITQNDQDASSTNSPLIGISGAKEGGGSSGEKGPSDGSKDENGLSYSAQIAQQFSAYQQTPSQERQQRSASSTSTASTNGVTIGTAPIATLDSSNNGEVVYGKKPSEMHDHGKLFIGGLSWDTTDGTLFSRNRLPIPTTNHTPFLVVTFRFVRLEGLAKYFSQFGKVDACTIMRDPSGTSRGFAFLTYEDGLAVNSVITREHFLDGKTIDPKRAIPREEHLRNTRYFVGGLAPNTTSESMKDFFSAFGKVVDATVMLDRDTGRSKGFGFVTFEDATNTDQLVGKALMLDDKQIEVKAAQPRSQRDQARNSMPNTPVMGNGTSGNRESFENRIQATNVPFVQQQNPMSMLLQAQRGAGVGNIGMGNAGGMNQMPMNMNVNPMAMMNMMNSGMGGMGGMNMMNGMNGMVGSGGSGGMGMMNGMNMMGGGMGNMGMMGGSMGGNMGGMNAMGNMGGMANMGGMGNMANMANMNNMGGGMRLGMGPMGGGMAGGMIGMGMRQGMNGMAGLNRMQNAGVGPLRMQNNRGQHNFHPYSR
ncbi:hypothetical protein L218DRAFT_1008086 [Marasmius fiardii PR-910]|nr:hypothetical protein L218DRAFT_1008086 [Marasmius fiardii PR-910]